jgi:hypothetical protein
MKTNPIGFIPPARNTQLYQVLVRGVVFTISYRTVIAVAYGKDQWRRKNVWGRTTAKHFKEAGVDHYPIIENVEEFHSKCEELICQAVVDQVAMRLTN